MNTKIVYGCVVSMQPNGVGIVKLENEGEGYFDRFDILATEIRKKGPITNGSRIKAISPTIQKEIIHLTNISLA